MIIEEKKLKRFLEFNYCRSCHEEYARSLFFQSLLRTILRAKPIKSVPKGIGKGSKAKKNEESSSPVSPKPAAKKLKISAKPKKAIKKRF